MTEREALKLALKALEAFIEKTSGRSIRLFMETERHMAIYAWDSISQVLAQHDSVQAKPEPEQEPVAMRYDFDGYGYKYIDSGSGSDWKTRIKGAEPLYTTPPQRKPLTRERLVAMADVPRGVQTFDDWVELFGREIEAAHGITGDKK